MNLQILTYQLVTYPVVVILLVVVQPDLGESDGVPPENVDPAAPLVRRALAENVTHVGAGDNLQGATAHPRLQAKSELNIAKKWC